MRGAVVVGETGSSGSRVRVIRRRSIRRRSIRRRSRGSGLALSVAAINSLLLHRAVSGNKRPVGNIGLSVPVCRHPCG